MKRFGILLVWFMGWAVAANGTTQAAAAPWQVPGTPIVVTKTVHFQNGGANLTGTLYMPATGDHLPAIVALHGADTPTRDYALFRHLTEALPAMGMAVLVFDRRGSGQSSGSLDGVGYDTLADDGIAGARAIAQERRIDPARIGYWGLSQGGWLSVAAGGRDSKTAFVVSVSAPLVTASQQMHFATKNQLYLHGASQADIKAVTQARDIWGRLSARYPHAQRRAGGAWRHRKQILVRPYLHATPRGHDAARSIRLPTSDG